MRETLKKHIPAAALDKVEALMKIHPFIFKIVKNRYTKHGDFRKLKTGEHQITLNKDLNSYRFLLTLIHEIAHLTTFQKFGRVKPHGKEWKMQFRELMLPFLHPDIYPDEILPFLANYLKNPKAATDSDSKLSLVLKQFDERNGKSFIFEVPLATRFVHRQRIFELGQKRRTRYECIELKTGKRYLFHQNAEVLRISGPLLEDSL